MNELTEIKINVKMGNAAMQNEMDLGSALQGIAEKLQNGERPEFIRDLNGNRVGTIEYKED